MEEEITTEENEIVASGDTDSETVDTKTRNIITLNKNRGAT
jgi:hypothetical protein